ncbi:hypothetical protein [Pseudohoeflea coraliihabitans]|uniref:Uncharacterized protein n=1 Tax=Pseudohoeflea coraliihabitans TaxID=2860393 RepID=A0ABS6WIJ2_9HYPH|nr:hypothetical protein [Pseudohoeflea sp. DP4N28-3]MBW3095761.1 hypothetical protein [Pseudohoeflea sp. DP4N28-3]
MEMLFIFNKSNGVQIAWHSQAPQSKFGRGGLASGFARLIRTRSAG